MLHQPYGILIDFRLGFRIGRVTFKHVACQFFAQRLCNLAAAGIVNAEKGGFFYHSFSLALILQIIWVMVPMGQKLHQALGLKRVFTTRPMMVEVSIRL